MQAEVESTILAQPDVWRRYYPIHVHNLLMCFRYDLTYTTALATNDPENTNGVVNGGVSKQIMRHVGFGYDDFPLCAQLFDRLHGRALQIVLILYQNGGWIPREVLEGYLLLTSSRLSPDNASQIITTQTRELRKEYPAVYSVRGDVIYAQALAKVWRKALGLPENDPAMHKLMDTAEVLLGNLVIHESVLQLTDDNVGKIAVDVSPHIEFLVASNICHIVEPQRFWGAVRGIWLSGSEFSRELQAQFQLVLLLNATLRNYCLEKPGKRLFHSLFAQIMRLKRPETSAQVYERRYLIEYIGLTRRKLSEIGYPDVAEVIVPYDWEKGEYRY